MANSQETKKRHRKQEPESTYTQTKRTQQTLPYGKDRNVENLHGIVLGAKADQAGMLNALQCL